jgi:uncharacterized protein
LNVHGCHEQNFGAKMRAIKAAQQSQTRQVIAAEDEITNPNGGPEFMAIVKARLDRRNFLRGTGASAAVAAIGTVGLSACGGGGSSDSPTTPPPIGSGINKPTALTFANVDKIREDRFTVPTGYTARAFYCTGDPIAAGVAAYSNLGTDDSSTYNQRAGDNHDGIEYFPLNDSGTAPDINGNNRGILAMNHEYITQQFLHAATAYPLASPRVQEQVTREVAMHGVSVVEVMKQTAGGVFSSTGNWNYVQTSGYNRRITAATRIELSGPVRGNSQVFTKYSPTGTTTRGTLNNCGTGYSLWGTLLTCEENWAGYFSRATAADNTARGGATAKDVISLTRYSVSGDRYGWGTLAATTAAGMAANALDSAGDLNDRWNANLLAATADLDYRNIANTFGWVVEIDPYTPSATPKKRTALGRFAHEAAVSPLPTVGQPIAVYMGDDSRGDYIYKYVSTATWAASDATAANRMATGDKFLDAGTLHVAKFNADGTGTWIPLTITNPTISGAMNFPFTSQADVCLNTRLAADAVGATRMDRPEWGAINPLNNEVYFTLTENNATNRPVGNIDAANPRFYQDVRDATNTTTAGTNTGNPFGHILRLRDANTAATSFTWDVYLFGAQADADPTRVNLSGLSTANDFARADGLWFSQATGICWVQTDDSGAFLDQTNCMMLAALPGQVGDGVALPAQAASVAVAGSTPAGAALAATRRGAQVTSSTLRRFLVGPRDQEITGVTETPDGRTMFVNVQHPGEDTPSANTAANAGDFNSYWPRGERAPGSVAAPTGQRPTSATVVITKNDGGRIGT